MTLTIIVVYLAMVLFVGVYSNKLFRGTGEDYFLATRTIGPFVLLMSLFGTNMTAFALLGSSGEAYHTGIGVFGLMASTSALVIPTVFFFIGTRLWSIGKRYGYLTQIQYFRDRWGSDAFGLLLFCVLVALVVPYLLIGVMAGGLTLFQLTGLPQWLGALVIVLVVMTYVTFGGLRGTAWANTFQTLVFMLLGAVTFFVIVNRMGGLSEALTHLQATEPDLLVRGERLVPLRMLTYSLIPLSVGMFPHLFMHWLTAKKVQSFRLTLVAYPLCITAVWLPAVLLGVLGHVQFPGLEVPASNSVLVRMIGFYAPGVLAGLLGAGVFAAVMSSLDSQTLSLGTMFTQDIVRHYGYQDSMSDRQQVLAGRAFVTGILAVTYVIFLFSNTSIFAMGTWSFTGFAALFPVVAAALFWKRSTVAGATASVLTVAVLWTYFFSQGWGDSGYTVGGIGLMAVSVITPASALAMIIVSLMTSPPDEQRLAKFFPPRS